MKKTISTIVAIGFISSMLVNTGYADGRRGAGVDPLWVPAAIISTLAAITIPPPPDAYERRGHYEPRPVAPHEEPRYDRHGQYHESDRPFEAPRHRDYR